MGNPFGKPEAPAQPKSETAGDEGRNPAGIGSAVTDTSSSKNQKDAAVQAYKDLLKASKQGASPPGKFSGRLPMRADGFITDADTGECRVVAPSDDKTPCGILLPSSEPPSEETPAPKIILPSYPPDKQYRFVFRTHMPVDNAKIGLAPCKDASNVHLRTMYVRTTPDLADPSDFAGCRTLGATVMNILKTTHGSPLPDMESFSGGPRSEPVVATSF